MKRQRQQPCYPLEPQHIYIPILSPLLGAPHMILCLSPTDTLRSPSLLSDPPAYDADHPPPYFPDTPLEPWLSLLRQPHWEFSDLSAFTHPENTMSWTEDHASMVAQLDEWGLPADPNEFTREAIRDPFGWCGLTDRDLQFVDGCFSKEIANTVLGLCPCEQGVFMSVRDTFNPALLRAIEDALRIGVYPHRHDWRPIRFHMPDAEGRSYHAEWMLASLGRTLPRTLGQLLLRQDDYTRLVKALFIVQARKKWLADAKTSLERRQSNPIYRWKHERSHRKTSSVQMTPAASTCGNGIMPTSFSMTGALGHWQNLFSTSSSISAQS